MTYGYQQGGSFGAHKQALGFDAGASEKLRLEAAMKEKTRIERDRAKMQLADLNRKLEHAKTDISHRLTEVRRLEMEFLRGQTELQSLDHELKILETKEHELKVKSADTRAEAEKTEKQLGEEKKKSETVNQSAVHLQAQIADLQQQLLNVKRAVSVAEANEQKIALKAKQLDALANKHLLDAEHAKNEKAYKEKDVENKKKAHGLIDEKKKRELLEIERMRAEISKLEIDIRQVEPKAR